MTAGVTTVGVGTYTDDVTGRATTTQSTTDKEDVTATVISIGVGTSKELTTSDVTSRAVTATAAITTLSVGTTTLEMTAGAGSSHDQMMSNLHSITSEGTNIIQLLLLYLLTVDVPCCFGYFVLFCFVFNLLDMITVNILHHAALFKCLNEEFILASPFLAVFDICIYMVNLKCHRFPILKHCQFSLNSFISVIQSPLFKFCDRYYVILLKYCLKCYFVMFLFFIYIIKALSDKCINQGTVGPLESLSIDEYLTVVECQRDLSGNAKVQIVNVSWVVYNNKCTHFVLYSSLQRLC